MEELGLELVFLLISLVEDRWAEVLLSVVLAEDFCRDACTLLAWLLRNLDFFLFGFLVALFSFSSISLAKLALQMLELFAQVLHLGDLFVGGHDWLIDTFILLLQVAVDEWNRILRLLLQKLLDKGDDHEAVLLAHQLRVLHLLNFSLIII